MVKWKLIEGFINAGGFHVLTNRHNGNINNNTSTVENYYTQDCKSFL